MRALVGIEGNTAFRRCSAERLLEKCGRSVGHVELDERSEATTAPVTAAMAHAVTRSRSEGTEAISWKSSQDGTILQFTSYNSQFTKRELMPARPTWKGYLKISLVNIPIKVFPATDAGATLSFNQLHAECQTRIQQKRWCPHCEREVPNTELVKGSIEFEKGHYVVHRGRRHRGRF